MITQGVLFALVIALPVLVEHKGCAVKESDVGRVSTDGCGALVPKPSRLMLKPVSPWLRALLLM